MPLGRATTLAIASVATTALTTTTALASGYAISQQSASALGNALAGSIAGAEDLTYGFFNPAAFARHDGVQAATVGTLIAPHAASENAIGTTAAGTSAGGGSGGGDVTPDQIVPAFYGLVPLGEDLRLGLSITVPWGLETDYDRGWAGRYHALNTRLVTANINPVLAWRVTDRLQIGGGLQVQYASGELSEAIDFGTIGAGVPGAQPGAMDGSAEMEADDWGVGFNLGLLFEPTDRLRLGLAYRSRVRHELDGDVAFDLGTSGMGAAIAGASGGFVDGGARTTVVTPDTLGFGVHYEVTPAWAVMAEATWTNWSVFDDLTIGFDNPAQPDSITTTDWNDSWFFALGATWRPAPVWTLRAGVAFDQSPVPDRTRNPRIPDADRQWLSLGVGYEPAPGIALEAAYTHLFMDKARIDLDQALPGNALRGDLSGEVESRAELLSLQLRLSF
jgi:long-chain fatty acid transport protein